MALHRDRGIAATTMKDIAERADVGIGTVYHHFPSYEDAIRACGARTAQRPACRALGSSTVLAPCRLGCRPGRGAVCLLRPAPYAASSPL